MNEDNMTNRELDLGKFQPLIENYKREKGNNSALAECLVLI